MKIFRQFEVFSSLAIHQFNTPVSLNIISPSDNLSDLITLRIRVARRRCEAEGSADESGVMERVCSLDDDD